MCLCVCGEGPLLCAKMCTRSQPLKREDEITDFIKCIASKNCDEIMERLSEKDELLDAYRKAFIAYIDAFQYRFKSAIDRRFQSDQEQEPWSTNYVTLKPWVPEESRSSSSGSSSLVAKAHKITKKACVLFNHEPPVDALRDNNTLLIGSVDLYAKCIKESPIDWTCPEKAQDESTLKNVWQKSKLRLVMLSAGALIEVTHPKHSHKPLVAYFAQDIREVRSTSPLETPDDDLNFVIRTVDNRELLIKAQNCAEKSSWILIIRRVCSSQETKEVANNEDGSLNYDMFLEELRLIGNVRPISESMGDQRNATVATNVFHDQETNQFLGQYPWYHGSISRSESANLVLHQHARHILAESGATETFQTHAANSSGVFLLRQSGTRQGEYVSGCFIQNQ